MNAPSAEVSSVTEDWTELRKSTGISLEEISTQTHIPVPKLEALERHEFDKLGTTTFVSGYIRRYAKIIKQDPQAFIQVYLETLPAESAVAANETQSVMAVKPGTQTIWKKVGLLPFAVIAIVVWGGVMLATKESDTDNTLPSQSDENLSTQESRGSATVDDNTTIQDAPVVDDVNPGDSPIEESQTLRLSVPNNASLAESATIVATPETTATPLPVSAPAISAQSAATEQAVQIDTTNNTPASATGDALVFTFSEDCWVNVEDATGRVLIAQLKRKGDNLQLFGQAPFSVLLGNARAVTLTANGRVVSTTPPGNKKTHRFNVNG